MLNLVLFILETPEQENRVEISFKTYYKKMVNIALDVVKNIHDAEEIAMSTFLKLCENPNYYLRCETEEEFVALLSVVTKNAAKDAFRQNRRNAGRLAPLEDELTGGIIELEDPEADLSDMVIAEENKQMLIRAIGTLDEMYRAPLLLQYGKGCSSEEVADMLGIKVNTARIRVHRGRKLLKEQMLKMGYIR